ncbi:tRNA glutamyl-Q(34) synthetase GluQRS [Enterovirga sp.]|uniref:tRNA glutamyl-Q(34) synthetase GluQRS n=1 Tax=Enterovirga sp. TaxID=2026350 RepID=UPI00262E91AA|nr:tRNA glutamyl-Q(34) synthetase GluQRS [Enterovirga sp.]MDB5590050.1 tRNA glutamyl-Q(34) synthetase GluQRS [Enterovirga sp.]
MTRPVFRFAPSPNGRLHLGHAYSALLNDHMARRAGGRFLVRIEDIDPHRSKPEFTRGILEDLAWLGLRWEEPVRLQSRHLADYGRAVRGLRERGLVYPCFCSRGDIRRDAAALAGGPMPRDPDGSPLYPGTCRHGDPEEARARIAAGLVPAWRLDTARALAVAGGAPDWTAFDRGGEERRVPSRPGLWGDPVVARRDVPTSYHLSVVVDDAVQAVSHVVRGRDLESATDLHALLQRLLGLPAPRYHHHDLVLDPAGRKLAKSLGSVSLDDARRAGAHAAAIRRDLGFPA